MMNSSSIAKHRAGAAAAAAALCMHVQLTFRLVRRRLSQHRTYFDTGNKYITQTEKEKIGTHNRKALSGI